MVMHRKKPQLTPLWQALDEAAFGAERTLNLRESLPSASEARSRAEVWLRARQVTRAGDVLVITGRGNQSSGGIGVIRQEILGMLPSLRRRGVVESWKEHSPGSLVIRLAPMSALLTAPKRRRGVSPEETRPDAASALKGLDAETLRMLRQLAVHSLESLGVDETEPFVEQEMMRTFSTLVAAIPEGVERESGLRRAIRKAIDEASELS